MSDALVIGGGLAGAAAAIGLAGAGCGVTLFDKAAGPHHKVCGEFLSGEAVDYLARLGLPVAALGAVPIETVRLSAGRRVVESPLPFPAWSLSRYRLDAALLALAETAGVAVRRGMAVQEISRSGPDWTLRLKDGAVATASAVFLATGKHDLRGHKRPAGRQNDLVGFKLHYRLALPGTVELALFPGGYAGLEPVEDGIANLCLVIRQASLARLGGSWETVQAHLAATAPRLAGLLKGAEPLWPKPLSITAIPYGLVQRETLPGIWRLGDQAAVIPSFSGDGMSIALHSAARAVQAFVTGETAELYQARLAGELRGQVGRATLLSKALVSRAGQVVLPPVASLFPQLLAYTASRTRIAPAFRL